MTLVSQLLFRSCRLRYLLAAGVKEGLVERAIEWPGVHSARALTCDHPLRGWWFDRSKEYAARRRGEHYGRFEYATEETVALDPLPCWRHLPIKEVQRRVKDLIHDVEREAASERLASEKPVLGAEAVMVLELSERQRGLRATVARQPPAVRTMARCSDTSSSTT